jgi:2-phospho-L-lactate guanylyltransferase (CobY/MobA/RfbA family)
VIPVKSFTLAKGRLADTLTASQRSALAQSCAETVVYAALSLPTYVVCSDDVVASWAKALGAHIVDCQTPGLDIAVATGRSAAEADGADHHIAREGKVTLVPDRHRDGTNVLSFPINNSFTTAYGPGSCDNHIRLAIDAGLEYEIIEDNDLALDLDTADDLSELARRETEQQ